MKTGFIISLFFLLIIRPNFGQSDNCATATVINLDPAGSACVSGTTVNATSANVGYSTCNPLPDVNNEVWYTYVTNGSNNVFDITPQGMTNPEIVIYTVGCGSFLQTCNNSVGSGVLSTPWGLPIGTQVWIGIMSNQGTEGGFDFCVSSTAPAAGGGNTCGGALPLCDVNATTSVDMATISPSGDWPPCFGSAMQNDVWFTFTCYVSGTLEFEAIPTGNGANQVELDWALYNNTTLGGCPVAVGLVSSGSDPSYSCNYGYANGTGASSGMSSNPPNGQAGNEYNAPVNLVAGETYTIVMDYYSGGGTGLMDFSFLPGMTAAISPVVDFTISPTTVQCAPSVDITITDNSIGVPDWDFGNGNTYTGNSPPVQTYPASGTYAITATISGSCTSTMTEFVQVFGPLVSTPVFTDETCIGDCDGEASVTISGGSGTYDYFWSPNGETTASINGLCSGNYSVTVSDAICGTSVTESYTIGGINCATCLLTNLTANVSACNPIDDSYTTSGVIEFTDPPLTGTLTVSDCNGVQQVFIAPFTSPTNYNLTGQSADGAACDITAIFSADVTCTQTVAYTAPICLCNMDNLFASIGSCDGVLNIFQVTGDVAFTSPPGSGTLIVEVDNGTTVYDTIINLPFVSPQTWSISGIPADGSALTVTTYFSTDPACTTTINSTAPADCSCAADVGTFTSTLTGVGTTNYVLCFGDQIDITANGDMVPPGEATAPPGPTYDPGLLYLAYTCPPTVFPPDDLWDGLGNPIDPCLIGIISSGNIYSDVNTIGAPPNYGSPYINNTIYYVPITSYSIVDNIYSYTNTTVSCYDMGIPVAVQYLPQVIAAPTEDCFAGTITVAVSGGLPAVDGSLFTGSNLVPATASFTNATAGNGGSIIVAGLLNGDNYSFDIIDANGCPITITGTFTAVPVANAGADDMSCTLSYALNPTVSFGTGTWAGPGGVTFSPNSNTANATVTVPTEGAYTFTWTEDNGNGCISTNDVVVTFSNLTQNSVETCPSVLTTMIQGGYIGTTGFNIASNLLPGTAFFTNTTAANGATITVDGLQNGDNYSFDITDDNGCVINISGGPFVGTPVSNAGVDDVSCALTYNLNAIVSFGTGTWTGPVGTTFSPNVNVANAIVTVPSEGSYTFTWTEDNGVGCSSSDDVIVTFSNLSQTFVEDCQTATVTATVNGAYTGTSGNVTASNLQPVTATFGNTTAPNGGNIVVNGLLNGDMYSFDITDDNGCLITVAGGPYVGVPIANAGIDGGACVLTYTLSPIPSYGVGTWTGPVGATFSPNANTENATVTVPNDGSYTFTWTEDNGNGCISTDDVIVQFSDLIYSESVVQSTCGNANGSFTLNASNGITSYQYSIDGGITFPNTTGTFTGLLAGSYNVAVQDALGCVVTGVVIIIDQSGPIIISVDSTDVLCNASCDGSIAINATGATEFSIDNGVTFSPANTFTNLCTGTYDIVVQNAIGCQDTSLTTINQPNAISVSTTTVDLLCFDVCAGEINISATGGTETFQYSVDNGVTNQLSNNFTGLCAGVYDILVQDANLCIATTQTTLTEPTQLTGTIGSTDETCAGSCDGTVSITVPNGSGTSPYTYNWTGIIGGTSLFQQNLCAGNYEVIVTDNSGCIYVDNIGVLGAPAVAIDFVTTTDELCGGDQQGSITINTVSAVTTYYIELNGTLIQTNTTGVFTGLGDGIYDVFIEDASQCSATDVAVIFGPPPVTIEAFTDTTICSGGTATLNSLAAGGVGAYVYTWDNGSFTQSINVSPLVPGVYCVTANDGNGCASPSSCVTVSMYLPLNVTALSDQSLCVGESASISASASGGLVPYTYTWSSGIGSGQNQTVTPGQTMVYTVTVTDACETPADVDFVTVTVNTVPNFTFEGDLLEGCSPVITNFTEIDVPAGSICSWDFGDGNTYLGCSGASNPFTQTGCWDVTLSIITPEGCPANTAIQNYVCVYDYPTADFTFGPQPTNVLNPTINFVNQSIGASEYNWIFGVGSLEDGSQDVNPTYTFPSSDPGTYEVCLTAISTNSTTQCEDEVCYNVVIDEEFIVYVPNAFTPGNDLLNNIFIPRVKGVNPFEYSFIIFNRWGELIFESSHPSVGWDGYYKNVLSQTDVYVWKLSCVDASTNKTHEYIGHVTLMK